ncbi:Asp23/Gls24 family envelope stress response protein [Williamsia herbipolensis]|uniref:Alkaline shock response membrane anchor protein AmaP n=1 Tax=Williamsia herbipolensis TaxID=1603258 RepID=A0AAU4JY02_9NOCA|nr:Asp23/Gls24 family envelope stress response protein [Williamsia herbipolensis]MCX6468926.1 Asp23/Gls24 family envelope stress response protein [Mycobacteriales bacterium]
MADPTTGAAPGVTDGGGPGTTTIHDRVGEQIGRAAALSIEGVLRHRGSLGLITGGDHPKVSIDMSRPHPDVKVDIAVRWPTQVTALCQEVRALVHTELARLTGVTPHRVDVTIADVIVAETSSQRRVR